MGFVTNKNFSGDIKITGTATIDGGDVVAKSNSTFTFGAEDNPAHSAEEIETALNNSEGLGDAALFHSDYNKTVVDALREAWVETQTDTETSTVSVELSLNASYIYGDLTSLEITDILPTSENVGCHEFSFTSGATATNFVYPDGWLWKGDDCEDYVFVPQANTYYEMIIEYRNGMVTGYASAFEVEVSADE